MEFFIAWYPTLKFGIFLTLVTLASFLVYHKWFKTTLALVIVSLLFMWLAPVKIDGTSSYSAHKAETNQRTQEYRIVESERNIVTTHKPTFKERMAEEEQRSDTANKKLSEEIK